MNTYNLQKFINFMEQNCSKEYIIDAEYIPLTTATAVQDHGDEFFFQNIV